MRGIGILGLALLGAIYAQTEALAQFGSSTLRTQTRNIERSVSRSLERIFKPKLVVAKGATGAVTAMALSADEHYLLSAVGNNSVRVWDLWAGREIARLAGHSANVTGISLSPAGDYAVTVAADKKIKLWSLKKLGQVLNLGEHQSQVSAVVLGGDAQNLVTASEDGILKIWAMPEGKLKRDIPAHKNGRIKLALVGEKIISGGEDGFIRVWDENGNKLKELALENPVSALAVSRDSSSLAVGLANGEIRFGDVGLDKLKRLGKQESPVLSLGFGPSAGQLVSGGEDGRISLWNNGDAEILGKHEAALSFSAINTDGGFALSASRDGTSRLWNIASKTQLLTLISTEEGWAVVDAKGRYDGSQRALQGIEWQGEDAASNIDDFAEVYYQAALLSRTIKDSEPLPDAKTITEGVYYPPKVEIRQHKEDARDRSVVVEVVAEDNGGGGVTEIRLYRNGKLVPREGARLERQDVNGRPRLVGSYSLEIREGETTLAATALNSQKLESRPQVMTFGQGQAQTGSIHLLTVGINKYREAALELFYAKPDAQAIADFFAGKKPAFPVKEQLGLRDQAATKEGIRDAIRALRRAPPEDMVVVYLAGHGINVGEDWYFISHEVALPEKPEAFAGIALSSGELKAEMEALNANRTLLLLDTCQSGAAVSPIKDYKGMKALRMLARAVGTHVLAATDRTQSAFETQTLGHGLFTYALLKGLEGKADRQGDGMVSVGELISFVEEAVPQLSKELADESQFPTGYSRGVDFPLTVTKP